MPVWNYDLDISDVFHNETMSLEQIQEAIVRRIQMSRFWDSDDFELQVLTENIRAAETVKDFDYWWNQFYYWFDDNRVWVSTQ